MRAESGLSQQCLGEGLFCSGYFLLQSRLFFFKGRYCVHRFFNIGAQKPTRMDWNLIGIWANDAIRRTAQYVKPMFAIHAVLPCCAGAKGVEVLTVFFECDAVGNRL